MTSTPQTSSFGVYGRAEARREGCWQGAAGRRAGAAAWGRLRCPQRLGGQRPGSLRGPEVGAPRRGWGRAPARHTGGAGAKPGGSVAAAAAGGGKAARGATHTGRPTPGLPRAGGRAGGGGSAGPGRVVPRLPPRRGSARRGPAARPRGGGGAAQVAGADGCRSRRQPRSALPARLGLPGRAAARLFPSGPAPATGSGSEGPRYGRPGRRSHGSWRSLGALPASPHRLLGGRRGHGGR